MSPECRSAARSPSPWLLPRRCELLRHQVVVDRALDATEHAERHRTVGVVRDAGEPEREARLRARRVVDEERVLARLGDVDHAQRPVRVLDDALLALGAEPDPLAVLEVDAVALLLAHVVERAVVVDVAVLEDLDERRAAVARRRAEDVREAFLVGVDRARDERRLGADRHGQRVERMVERAHRRRLRHLAEFATWASTGPW